MTEHTEERLKPLLYEGPPAWLTFVGVARLLALTLIIGGAWHFCMYRDFVYVLLALYGVGLLISGLYLAVLFRQRRVSPLLTWTQMLVDFGLVAATLGFTGGVYSFFTFLIVIVILEAGLLLGMPQGFVFATLATVFMAIQTVAPPLPPRGTEDYIELGYRFVIQAMAFYLTAFVSGYWNQRVNRMEKFQRRILDNMNSGFLMTDHAGIVTVINRVAYGILELPEGYGIGKPVQELLRPVSGSECPIVTALRSGRDFISYEFLCTTGPSRTKLLGLTTSQIQEGGKAGVGILASFSDLTEMSEMRQELQRQDRLAVVGELAAGLAHEIRNPVAAIRGAVEELTGGAIGPELEGKLLAIALRESDHLNQIVSDFLNFAKNPTLRRETFDLRELAAEVKEHLMEQFGPGNGQAMITILPDVPCPVSGDRSQLKMVFLNLGENAFEAMRSQGTLTVTLTPSPGSYEIRFEDEGPGVHPDKITKIFEPFYTEKERGVGMGLAICMRIITAHDGTIRAGSREGGGAAFVVRVPAALEGKE